MASHWAFCLRVITFSQSSAAAWSVRFAAGAGPRLTAQVPSLMMACHVPPPAPGISYWTTALTPAALAA